MNLKISRILHAGYVFECGGTQIAFDPIFENPFSHNCYAFPNVQFDQEQIKKLNFAAVFISHFHDDHCSLESLHLLDRKTPIYLYCIFEELFLLIKELGFTCVYALSINEPVILDNFEIIPRRALDADVDSMFHIRAVGLNVLNVVDSWIDSETLQELASWAPWDMVLWPFQIMRETEVLTPSRTFLPSDDGSDQSSHHGSQLPAEWFEQLRVLNPHYVVPSSCQFIQESWSWYNHALFSISYQQFESEMQAVLPKISIVRLNPSTGLVLHQRAHDKFHDKSIENTEALSWVQPIGNQDVDYDYRPWLKAPSTAEVARHMTALSIESMQRVLEYCNSGLLIKYRSMDPPQESYFHKPRLWRLSIYDHRGEVTNVYYRVVRANIERVMEGEYRDQEPLAWATEIPFLKFFTALEKGESLTSMYMRINDVVFDTSIEKEIEFVDILEDPLLRCLFNGAIASYQKAQLERIKKNKPILFF